MAIPRRIQPEPIKLSCRTQADFPSFLAAADKLTDLQTTLGMQETEYRELENIPPRARPSEIDIHARALLAGAAVAVDTVPDIADLRREIAVTRRAIQFQEGILEQERGVMARAIAQDLAADHRALMSEFIAKQNAANAAFDAIKNLRVAADSLTGTETLPRYDLDPQRRLIYVTAVQVFADCSTEYREGRADA